MVPQVQLNLPLGYTKVISLADYREYWMVRSKQAQKALSDCFNECSYCSRTMVLPYGNPLSVTLDHVLAKSKGGTSKVASCFECNAKKSNKPLIVFLGELFKDDKLSLHRTFTHVTSFVSESERLRIARETSKLGYEGMRLGKPNNFQPRDGRHKNNKSNNSTQHERQGKLF